MTTNCLSRWTLAMSLAGVLAACDGGGGDADSGTPPEPDGGSTSSAITDVAAGDSRFSILVAALSRADLVDTLSGTGPFTVFAPTDDAFAASGIALADIQSMDVAALQTILRYHVVAGRVTSAEITAGPVDTVATAGGGWNLDLIVGTEGGVTLNGGGGVTGGASVTTADIAADNGVIHVVDRVLLPPDIPTMATYAGLTDLAQAAADGGLDDDLAGAGPFTVFAPTNDAFPDEARARRATPW